MTLSANASKQKTFAIGTHLTLWKLRWFGESLLQSSGISPGMSWLCADTLGIGRGNGAGSGAVAGLGLIFGVVLRRPLRGRFICPFDMAGLRIRYFCTVFAVRCGASFRKPALIALSNKDIGGLHKLWCMNFTPFSLLVWWYEKDACSNVACAEVLVLDTNAGVAGLAAWNIGRVHKLLFGLLYLVKITFPLYMT